MMLCCLPCSGGDDMGVAAGLVGWVPWCFVVGAPDCTILQMKMERLHNG